MGMTMTQKILAKHAGLDSVEAGQLIEANLDLVLANDITNYFETGRLGIEHALLPEKGLVVAGDVVIGADSHTCTYGALGAFSTGVGSTDMAAGMATGQAWFKVPSAIKFNLTGKLNPWVSGKDVILHIIGMIGVDGALYQSMEFVGEGVHSLTMDDRFAWFPCAAAVLGSPNAQGKPAQHIHLPLGGRTAPGKARSGRRFLGTNGATLWLWSCLPKPGAPGACPLPHWAYSFSGSAGSDSTAHPPWAWTAIR